uniref:Succinate:cytochrome c oxidoreductase subunit 3 n=1 Tax=Coleochaete scutata TaxID=3125 RepID=A0A5P9NWR1_COLSC|nr:succinate:cytochrome c oxidoreductase subunit 3 [Coleochaete scutata]QFU80173.1 succinate:cytochrome c oxidoreductase subunit 3 [Coleochaete scutata]QIQ23025.1 succinate:cytochrome c oxidoreductase subunit 3 [Coleochaete scutata]
MKFNRPLSPHLTIYRPQLTSILSIFHRISGASLAIFLIISILFFKMCEFNLCFYYFYLFVFYTATYPFYWILFTWIHLTFLSLCYHMSNGIRHLLWDFGFFLDLPKVYVSGIIMLICAVSLALLNFLII